MKDKKFSILITTRNRKNDLLFTLEKISHLTERSDVSCIICDDGSTDGTYEAVDNDYPHITVIRNDISKGLIFSRNRMMNMTRSEYAISLDDDAHFLSDNVLENIEAHFLSHPNCGLLALRIFWGLQPPVSTETNRSNEKVKGFVGCGHVWNMRAWKTIPNYPDWFIFYGEEDFASYQLFKKGWEIHYVPTLLVNHRVDIKQRKNNSDYRLRTRRAFRAGWYLYFMFYPWHMIPKRLAYTLWMQLKLKTFKGDWKASLGLLHAIGDVIVNIPKLMRQSNRFTKKEFQDFSTLAEVKIYWKPEDEK